MECPEDPELERLLGQVERPQAPSGFERRVLARLREEREQSVWNRAKQWWMDQTLAFQGGLTAACAAGVLLVAVGGFRQWEQQKQETDQIVAALDAFDQYQQDQAKWSELDLYTWQ